MRDLERTVRMRPTANPKHIIHMFDGENSTRIIDLDTYGKTEITFGRSEENDIILSSKLVSRKHGKFIFEDGKWKIIDLGSTNGILHNGSEVKDAFLKNNDIVRIDDQTESKKEGVLMLFCED
ncbi:MAG: FHA domain-containing protein, partial [Clostridia bacterium]|nr:FHA domain-containing protein [Clostridia bacterium]